MQALGEGPWTVDAVRDLGWTDSQVRRAIEAGRLARPHRGVLAQPAHADGSLARVRAAVLVAGSTAVVSHESAARVHGLWLPTGTSGTVHLTVPGSADRTDHGMRLHGSRLGPEHVTRVDGIRVTSVARTAVDVARRFELPEAMMVVDSAAREIIRALSGVDLAVLRSTDQRPGLTALATRELLVALGSEWTWPGTVVARGAISLVEPASESPLESRSRGWMVQAKLPSPCIAYAVQGASGTWYVADFAWPSLRVLGEADGFEKYGLDDASVAVSLRAERRRQRDLEDAGWTFARWDSTEHPAVLIRRIRRTLRLDP